MTLKEIERIQTALNQGTATPKDFQSAVDEAVRFHHKVSELQEMLMLIKKKCQLELQDLENARPLSKVHVGLMLDYIVQVIEDSQHIRAA